MAGRQRGSAAITHKKYEHGQANIEMCRDGVSFLDLMDRKDRQPQGLSEQMSSSYAHGVGLENAWPMIRPDLNGRYGGGYGGVLRVRVTICIESHFGEVGGLDGIQFEEQILVTESRPETLLRAPFETSWL